MDVSARIGEVMALDPAVPVVQYEGRWSTWGEVRAIAQALEERLAGVPRSTPIALITRNRPGVVAAILGLLAARRHCLTINGMHPDTAVLDELRHLRPVTVIACAEDWKRAGLTEGVAEIGATGLRIGDDLSGVDEVVDRPAGSPPPAEGEPDVAISLQTSGTTGPPKRIAMTYANIDASVTGVLKHYGSPDQEPPAALRPGVAVQMLPLGHTSALLALCVMAVEGRRMVLLDRFEPWAWATAVRDHKIAVSGMPPAAIRMVLDAKIPADWLTSLRAVRAGTAPLDQALADEFTRTYDIPVIQAYGATEFQGVASWTLRDYKKFGSAKRGSVGRAHPGVDLRVVSPEDGTPLPVDTTGVLEVRSKQSAGARTDDWIRTSDLARIDADGFLFIEGRTDDVINRGGFKVDASEVADVLTAHPGVGSAVVVGAPDRRLGAVPVALVTPSGEADLPSEDELRDWVRTRLEAYKVPVRVTAVPELPRNGTMKVGVREVLELVGWGGERE
ncbi:class I adenylate-forming enzyme family protein [Amycolatopsis thermophila]|uniref:Acyl-CoA synthetase (AMP-forming)/AMP-acid ligase II n=1 Tax=Amycolatopsis thermophila TaxID=206084 RepID=A0ABU0F5F0_9PSEU|nr:long-chain fatty acid--CoA ligase [Amycolatopsis thermophila]MDQ0382818.1 acyl-CoA synthetase (AMP-forming)/AMP-acid ligase II [Amycolatopsis thermophila]